MPRTGGRDQDQGSPHDVGDLPEQAVNAAMVAENSSEKIGQHKAIGHWLYYSREPASRLLRHEVFDLSRLSHCRNLRFEMLRKRVFSKCSVAFSILEGVICKTAIRNDWVWQWTKSQGK